MPTTYQIHWGEADDLIVTDASGAAEKTGGTGGSFDASARAEQTFEGVSTVVCKLTYGVAGNMAFGLLPVATPYAKGAVTVASFVGCWSIEGGNCVVRESNTSRFSGAVALTDVLEIHFVMTSGAASVLYKQNGTTRYTSLLSSATWLALRPVRFVTTHSGAGSKWSSGTLDGESTELFDPDVSGSYAVALLEDPFDAVEYTPAAATYEVHAPDQYAPPDCPDPLISARAYVV